MLQNKFYKKLYSSETKVPPSKLILYFLIFFLFTLFTTIWKPSFLHDLPFDHRWIYYTLGVLIFTVILPLFYLKTKRWHLIKNFHITLIPVFALIFFTTAIELESSEDNFTTLVESVGIGKTILWIFLLFLIGYSEEFIFRKILFCQLVLHTKKINLSKAIVALAFAVGHIPIFLTGADGFTAHIIPFLYILFLGFLFTDIYYLTGSISIVTILHALMDTQGVLFAPLELYSSYSAITLLIMIASTLILRIPSIRKLEFT